jgi:hypothetical protein
VRPIDRAKVKFTVAEAATRMIAAMIAAAVQTRRMHASTVRHVA